MFSISRWNLIIIHGIWRIHFVFQCMYLFLPAGCIKHIVISAALYNYRSTMNQYSIYMSAHRRLSSFSMVYLSLTLLIVVSQLWIFIYLFCILGSCTFLFTSYWLLLNIYYIEQLNSSDKDVIWKWQKFVFHFFLLLLMLVNFAKYWYSVHTIYNFIIPIPTFLSLIPP